MSQGLQNIQMAIILGCLICWVAVHIFTVYAEAAPYLSPEEKLESKATVSALGKPESQWWEACLGSQHCSLSC